MEHIVYMVMDTIRNNRTIDTNTLLVSAISAMNLNIKQHEGLWYGEYDGLEDGTNDEGILDWIMGYMSAFYEF